MVGSHMIALLLSEGYKVIAAKRSGSNTDLVRKVLGWRFPVELRLLENLEWKDVNLFDKEEVLDNLQFISYVVHCAAIISFNPSDREKMIADNTTVTSNLVNAGLHWNIRKFCHVSSVAALGKASEGNETDERSPRSNDRSYSAYSISKYDSEQEVWRGIKSGLNAVIVNPSIILGPGDWSRNSQKMFPTVLNGLRFATPGITGYVDVQDVVLIIHKLMISSISGERFVLNSENKSYQEVLTEIAIALGRIPPGIIVKPWMLSLVWRFEKVRTSITGGQPIITRETAKSAFNKTLYSSEKVSSLLSFDFKSVKESIELTAEIFLKDYRVSSK